MNVSLTPELERFLNEQVRSGRYSSKEEAVGKAVKLLKDKEAAVPQVHLIPWLAWSSALPQNEI
jgi:putative addiction module CopG family antidote